MTESANDNPPAARSRRRRRGGFTLIEILISVLLLSMCLVAMAQLFSVFRKVTERSRDTSEYYAVARREAERLRTGATVSSSYVSAFNTIFNEGIPTNGSYTYYNPTTDATTMAPVYYTASGLYVGTSAGLTGYYKVTSTFHVYPTGSTVPLSQKVGIQQIAVALVSAPATTLFQTTIFFSPAGA